MTQHKYSNKYGSVVFEQIENYHSVREISSKDYDESLFFNIETGEQIALITENDKIQLSCVWKNGKLTDKMYIIHHASPSLGAVCKLIDIKFDTTISAENELEKLNKYKAMQYMY